MKKTRLKLSSALFFIFFFTGIIFSNDIFSQGISWHKEYTGRISGFDLFLKPNGDIAALCDTIVFTWGGTTTKPSFINTDSNGNINSHNILTDLKETNSFVQASDGGFFIAGSVASGSIQHFAISKTDNYSYPEWTKTYSPASTTNSAHDILMASDGNIVITGNYGFYAHVLKIDTNGDTIWTSVMSTIIFRVIMLFL